MIPFRRDRRGTTGLEVVLGEVPVDAAGEQPGRAARSRRTSARRTRHYAGDRCQADHDARLLSMRLRSWAKSCWRLVWSCAAARSCWACRVGRLDACLELGAGLADCFEGAVELGWPCAVAVAEQAVDTAPGLKPVPPWRRSHLSSQTQPGKGSRRLTRQHSVMPPYRRYRGAPGVVHPVDARGPPVHALHRRPGFSVAARSSSAWP